MPSHYAHYRFGAQLLPTLPADVRRPIQRFRRLYDVGLHGPDLFFYYSPFHKTAIGSLGSKYHNLTGQEYFTRICKRLRLEPSEAASAYLYGLLAHFCLDSVCHPFVYQHTDEATRYHTELEAEFERYLLEKDHKGYAYDFTPHMKLTPEECAIVADFYPPATPTQISQSVTNIARYSKILSVPEGAKRTAVKTVLSMASKSIQHIMIPSKPNPNCTELDEGLMKLYNQAIELYPKLLSQLHAHMTYNGVFGPEFDLTFEG